MAKHARELSGRALHRFFRRLFRSQAGLDRRTADDLTDACCRAIASAHLRRRQPLSAARGSRPDDATGAPDGRGDGRAGDGANRPATEPPPPLPAEKFDPYLFGLVPVFQREGRDGLLAKLAAIAHPDHLRHMARAQQIVLPRELRQGDIPAEQLRGAIADAVERRIAGRRAAAGS